MKSKKLISILIIIGLALSSCTNEAENKYLEIMSLIGEKHSGIFVLNKVSGNAQFSFNDDEVTVQFKALGLGMADIISLHNFELRNNGENNTYRIFAEFSSTGIPNGTFRLEIFGKNKPNTVYLELSNMDDKRFYSNIELSQKDFKKFTDIMKIPSSTGSQESEITKITPLDNKEHEADTLQSDKAQSQISEFLIIEGRNIWIRDKPTTGEVIMKLNSGDKCKILKRGKQETIKGNTDYWYQIEYKGKIGWFFGAQSNIKNSN